ncbi:MAG: adhesin transport system membrane fusion protein, partial [Parvicellaceae bacterium]
RNKFRQAKLKITSDSATYQGKQINYEIAKKQFDRIVELHNQGLKSLTDLENRKLKMQKANAEMIEAENKLLTTQNELINAQVEMTSVGAQFRDKISKSESDKFTAMSNMYDAEAKVTKLQNQYMNYSIRTGLYYITAPQNGYITKAIQSGLGETIKEGSEIISIMPSEYDLAIEMFIDPMDLPLIKKGEKVNIQFDGWPAIVFSGWPTISYGTYSGNVYAIDNFISDNGKYRVLVKPDETKYAWPDAVRVGGGTSSLLLLNDVPIWYELWRNFNGFPPDYYQPEDKNVKLKNK